VSVVFRVRFRSGESSNVKQVTLAWVMAMTVAAGASAQTKPAQTKPAQPAAAPGEMATIVSAPSATVHARCDEASPLRITLGRGERVVIQSVQDAWVNVRVPATGEEGCMRRATLERVPAMEQADQARKARQASMSPAAQAARRAPASLSPRAIVSINGIYQSAEHTFSQEQTFDLYQETARFTSSYEVKAGPGIDASGAIRLWRQLGAGVAFTSFKDDRDITIAGTLPSPLYFGAARPISGTTPGTREETAVHANAVFFAPVGKKLELLLFGGASFFSVKQTVVDSINYQAGEVYPFETTSFAGATVTQEKESKVGFNVGADVGFYFSKYIGVGGIVRFSRATIPFSVGDLEVGGAMVGGGVRLRIP
jgi:hypothetical protein